MQQSKPKNKNQSKPLPKNISVLFTQSPGGLSLDKIAQLGKISPETPLKLENLKKRARAKYAQKPIVLSLLQYAKENNLPLEKSYASTLYCSERITQDGQRLTAKYCKNRWCLVCNRIRTGILINKYESKLTALPERHFVTLTIPNVKGEKLKETIDLMQLQFKRIMEVFKKRKTKIVGLRKIECTYNIHRKDFHPHFHLVVVGAGIAEQIVKEWLNRFPDGSIKGQDLRPADNHSCKELFKYFTKLLAKDKRQMNPEALNTMFEAMKGIRVFQTLGGFGSASDEAEEVDDDIKDIRAEEYAELIPEQTEWFWHGSDWVNIQTGEYLTGYIPSNAIETFKNLIQDG